MSAEQQYLAKLDEVASTSARELDEALSSNTHTTRGRQRFDIASVLAGGFAGFMTATALIETYYPNPQSALLGLIAVGGTGLIYLGLRGSSR
jgi:hypothetical protein